MISPQNGDARHDDGHLGNHWHYEAEDTDDDQQPTPDGPHPRGDTGAAGRPHASDEDVSIAQFVEQRRCQPIPRDPLTPSAPISP